MYAKLPYCSTRFGFCDGLCILPWMSVWSNEEIMSYADDLECDMVTKAMRR